MLIISIRSKVSDRNGDNRHRHSRQGATTYTYINLPN